MAQTKIEWVLNPDGSQGITLNSKTGCQNHTPEGLCLGGLFPCYAWKLAHGRLKTRYLEHGGCFDADRAGEDMTDPFHPRWWPERLAQIKGIKKPTGIFLDSMSDWMGDYWPEKWTKMELQVMRDCPQHIFYTLTKQPQNLPNFSPFPENCWVGFTATTSKMFVDGMDSIYKVKAKVIYVSFEPLLEWHIDSDILYGDLKAQQVNWLIIGAQTKPYRPPKIEWVREIVEAADKAGIPVFLKDNLLEEVNYRSSETDFAFNIQGDYRQEMPVVK